MTAENNDMKQFYRQTARYTTSYNVNLQMFCREVEGNPPIESESAPSLRR